jgi:hypothetical protein
VWHGYEGYGSDFEIFLYDGTSTTQLTNDSYPQLNPQINDNGYVVWSGYDGPGDEIFLYDGTSTTQLTNNSYADRFPQINDNGYVAWERWLTGSDSEILLYDGTSTTQLTNNAYNDKSPQMNANGYVVWAAGSGNAGSDWEIFMAEPVGSATASSKDLRITIPGSRCFTINIENVSPLDFTVSPSVNWTDTAPSDVTFTGGPVSVPAGQSQSVNLPCFEVGSEAQPGDYQFDILWTGTDSGAIPVNITTDPTLHLVYSSSGAVGGTATMVNKIELLMPWIAITTLMLVAAGMIAIQRFKKKSS